MKENVRLFFWIKQVVRFLSRYVTQHPVRFGGPTLIRQNHQAGLHLSLRSRRYLLPALPVGGHVRTAEVHQQSNRAGRIPIINGSYAIDTGGGFATNARQTDPAARGVPIRPKLLPVDIRSFLEPTSILALVDQTAIRL